MVGSTKSYVSTPIFRISFGSCFLVSRLEISLGSKPGGISLPTSRFFGSSGAVSFGSAFSFPSGSLDLSLSFYVPTSFSSLGTVVKHCLRHSNLSNYGS